jgi:hypothetical protein
VRRTGVGVLLIGALPERVSALYGAGTFVPATSLESGCLIMQPKVGGKLHLRLNTDTSPIANKYREGKLKRTLKREFNST